MPATVRRAALSRRSAQLPKQLTSSMEPSWALGLKVALVRRHRYGLRGRGRGGRRHGEGAPGGTGGRSLRAGRRRRRRRRQKHLEARATNAAGPEPVPTATTTSGPSTSTRCGRAAAFSPLLPDAPSNRVVGRREFFSGGAAAPPLENFGGKQKVFDRVPATPGGNQGTENVPRDARGV